MQAKYSQMSNRFEVFADWLNAQLSRRGWNQSELSRKSGVTTGYLSQILSGQRKIGAPTARAIAKGLDIPESEVMIQAGLMAKPADYDALAQEGAEILKVLGKEDRDRILTMMRALLHEHRARSVNAPSKTSNGRKAS